MAYLGGCGDNVEIGFPVHRDTANTTLHISDCCSQQSGTNWGWQALGHCCKVMFSSENYFMIYSH
jgi:hypothetical protein